MKFARIGIEPGGRHGLVGDWEKPAADETLADGNHLDLRLDDLWVERQIRQEALGFGADAGDLEIVECRDKIAELVGIDFLGVIFQAVQFPLVREVLA